MALSKQKLREQLRKRIYLLFCPDNRAGHGPRPRPKFWSPHSEEQLVEVVHEFPIALGEGGVEEEKWLNEPNPAFGGKSPNDLLRRGAMHDLEKLETAIRAIEEGAFS